MPLYVYLYIVRWYRGHPNLTTSLSIESVTYILISVLFFSEIEKLVDNGGIFKGDEGEIHPIPKEEKKE